MDTIITKIPSRQKFLKGEDCLEIGYPWLTYGAIIALEHIINKNMSVLEFGSGGSTIFWAKNCLRVKSYETNKSWYEKVKSKTEEKKLNNVELILCHKDKMDNYINSEINENYDIVLIDPHPKHLERVKIAEKITPKVKVGGWLVIDNYKKWGMDKFDYSKWQVFTFDEFDYNGLGTRLCRKVEK